MALNQAFINIGTAPNDGQGDPVRTAFSKTNNNFSQLYSIPRSSPPATLQGSVGDFAGMYAYDSTYFYYCFANYTGNSVIWAQITQAGNIAVSAINDGNSNVAINGAGGNVIVAVNGTPSIATFATGGVFLPGVVSAAGNVRGGNINTNNDVSAGGNVSGTYIFGNGSQLTGLPATYSNANVAAYLPVYSGNLTAGNISVTGSSQAASYSATGNVTGGNILTGGLLSVTGNVTGGNLISKTYITAANGIESSSTYSGPYTDGVVLDYLTGNARISAGSADGIQFFNGGVANTALGGFNSAGSFSATGNVTANNINTTSLISATGNIVTAGYFVGNFAGNITGNLVVPGSNTDVLFNTNGNSDAVAGMTYNKGTNTFIVLGTVSSQGNTIAGNVVTVGTVTAALVSATGNITGSYILGNGSQLTGLPATYSNANVAAYLPTYSGNLTAGNISVTGSSQAASYSTTGNVTAGNIINSGSESVTGNITGGNILTAGLISATGGLNTNTTVIATGNIRGGNIISNGLITATGSITGNGILSTGVVSAAGNIAGAYVSAANDINSGGNVSAVGYTGTLISVTGNITGGNIITLGNVTGNYILGNGSQLTGLPASYSNANVATFLANFGSNTISTTGNVTAGNIINSGSESVTGNITSGNIITTLISAAGVFSANIGNSGSNIFGSIISASGNITAGNIINSGNESVTGNITGGNLSVGTGTVTVGNIVNANGNAVGNIGSSSNYFNKVFAQATTALYADLAERYLADADYAPGTVLSFGGSAEVTISDQDHDPLIAGIVSTDPAYCMNSGLTGDHVVTVALAGRVPCQVIGPVTAGAMMVSAGNGRARAEATPAMGTVIGKALQAFDGETGTIEIVVGRL